MGAVTVKLADHELSKNDVLDLFDQLMVDKHLEFYSLVKSDKAFNDFLTYAKLDPETNFLEKKEYMEQDFIDWVSPYYAQSYKSIAYACLREKNPTTLLTLISVDYYCSANDDEECTLAIRHVLESMIEESGRLLEETKIGDLPDKDAISKVFSEDWTHFFNNLSDLFVGERDNYAVNGINLGLTLHREKHKREARYIYEAIHYLECEPGNKEVLNGNYNVVVNKMSDDNSAITVLKVILYGAFILWRFSGGCN